MSKTIEAIVAQMVWPVKWQTALAKDTELSAQWQTGLETSSGHAQQKLRLSFAPQLAIAASASG